MLKPLFFAAACLQPLLAYAMEFDIQLETEQIRVSKWKVMPHEEIGRHRDENPAIVFALQGGTITRIEEDGSKNDVYFPSGTAVYRKPDPKGKFHCSVNSSETPVEALMVEIKDNPEREALKDVADRYISFLNKMGANEDVPYVEIIKSLCAPHCKKIFNGKLYTETRDDFLTDLLAIRKTQGGWHIKPVDIILSPENQVVVLRLILNMQDQGVFTTIVILRFNSDHLISEINEVFNKMESLSIFED